MTRISHHYELSRDVDWDLLDLASKQHVEKVHGNQDDDADDGSNDCCVIHSTMEDQITILDESLQS